VTNFFQQSIKVTFRCQRIHDGGAKYQCIGFISAKADAATADEYLRLRHYE
jgi:hypothetical protein